MVDVITLLELDARWSRQLSASAQCLAILPKGKHTNFRAHMLRTYPDQWKPSRTEREMPSCAPARTPLLEG